MTNLQDSFSLRDLHERLPALHQKARDGSITESERAFYEKSRDDLARMMVFAQQLTRKPGERFRQALRVQATLPVALARTAPPARWETTTADLSVGGFAAILADGTPPPSASDPLQVTLRLREGETANVAARVVGTSAVGKGVRLSVAFVDLTPAALEQVTLAVFDQVLSNLPKF